MLDFLAKAMMARLAAQRGAGGGGGFQMPQIPDVQGMSAGTTQDPVNIGQQTGNYASGYVANHPGMQAFRQIRSGGAGAYANDRMRQLGLGGLFGGRRSSNAEFS